VTYQQTMKHRPTGALNPVMAAIAAVLLVAVLSACGADSGSGGASNNQTRGSGY
jgi:hypothetical protein